MNKINVMVFKVGVKAHMEEINDDLEALKSIVDGYIEMIRFPNRSELIIICNEEGKLMNLTPQLDIGYDVICGDFLIARDKGDGDLESLNDEDIEFIKNKIK